MNIDLGNNLWIKSDERNFIITIYTGKDKRDKDTWKIVGYYTTITSLFKGLRQYNLHTEDITSIVQIGAVIKDSDKMLAEALKIEVTDFTPPDKRVWNSKKE